MTKETIKLKELLRLYYSYYGKKIKFDAYLDVGMDPDVDVEITADAENGYHIITNIEYTENS